MHMAFRGKPWYRENKIPPARAAFVVPERPRSERVGGVWRARGPRAWAGEFSRRKIWEISLPT